MSNDLIFFLSCNPGREEIDKCKGDEKIASIYHVSGVQPCLIVCKADSKEKILELNQKYQLNMKYMSMALPLNFLRAKKLPNSKEKNTFWVFIKSEKSLSIDQFKSFLRQAKRHAKFEVVQSYQLFGEYNFILKIDTSNIADIDSFLFFSRKKEVNTSTKCVLTTLKEEGKLFEDDIDRKKGKVEKIKREKQYVLARIMTNTKDFIQKSKEHQKRILKDKVREMKRPIAEKDIKRLLLEPNLKENEYSQYDLEHPNELIAKYSIKLERNNWLKVLLLFGAAPGKKYKLEDALVNELLRVELSQFSRKLYHMTGEYDFLVPLDCENLDKLQDVISILLNKHGELIERFTNTVCQPSEGKGEGPLEILDCSLIEVLLANATAINAFEQKATTGDLFSPLTEDKELTIEKEGITPREDSVRNKIKSDYSDDPEPLKEYHKNFKSFEDIGVKTTIEFKDGALIQALLKFYFINFTKKEILFKEIKKKKDACEIIAVTYEPVRNPLTAMCLLMVKDLLELEVMIAEFTKYCRKVEFHAILHQRYYSRTVNEEVRCKPCFHPVNLSGPNCDQCVRYILPRKSDMILNIDFDKKNINRNIKITLVGIDVSPSQLFALEKSLDQERKRKTVFKNYKSFIDSQECKNKEHFYESYEAISAQYSEIIKDKKGYRNRYKEAILEVLGSFDGDIILFPEYTIPSYVYNEISKNSVNRKHVIVAGSHIDKLGFNVCPVLFFGDEGEKKIYYLYKNNFSPFEEALGLVRNTGTAHLKFLNTIWGNIYIQICFDVYTVSRLGKFENVDILLVPSFNPSWEFKKVIKNRAAEYKLVAGYANTINEPLQKTEFFYPPGNGLKAGLKGVKPLHEKIWPKGEKVSREKIFQLSPKNNELKKIEKKGFNFRIKHLDFDSIQLDMRRKITSRREVE